jgi:hypothetical protein
MKGLDIKTKKMLDEHITPVNNNKWRNIFSQVII